MDLRLSLVVGLLLAGPPAGALDLVVPNDRAGAEGNFGNAFPFNTAASTVRAQQVYGADGFPFAEPITIHSLAFRARHSGGTEEFVVEISLSTTDSAPDDLSTVFALNVGADAAVVYDGMLSLSGSAPGDAPFPFEYVIPLQVPFVYDPAQGNLLLDVQVLSLQTNDLPALDFILDSDDEVSRVHTSGGAGGLNGSADSGGLITRFEISAPPYAVAPDGVASAEAPGDNSLPFFTATAPSLRYQQVYDAASLPFDGGVTIHSIAFRPDASAAPATETLELAILLSTTAAAPDALSPTFDANLGSDVALVLDDAIALSTVVTPPGPGPKDFDIVIPLETPFAYDPRNGNLLLDVRNLTSGAFLSADFTMAADDGTSRVVTQTFPPEQTANAATGLADSGGLVTRFGLPEPAAGGSAAAAALALGLLARARAAARRR